jgi:hypothetical protein
VRGIGVAAALVIASVAAAPAQGALVHNRFITPGGATSGSCSTAATACDYTYVLNGSGSTTDDTVTVLPGTYDVTHEPVSLARKLRLKGSGSARPVFASTSAGSTPVFEIPAAAAASTVSHVAVHAAGAAAIETNGSTTLTDLEIEAGRRCLAELGAGGTVSHSSFTQTVPGSA